MATNPPTRFCCSRAFFVSFFLVSAVPLATIIALERRTTANPSTYPYRSLGWFRECAKWDAANRRFLVSTFLDGGISEIAIGEHDGPEPPILQERVVVRDRDVAGNVSLGIHVDGARRRLLVAYADVFGKHGAVGAYDLDKWGRIFLTRLASQEDEPSYVDDVAVDAAGNAYITDAKASKIWKVDLKGNLVSVIRSHVFQQKHTWYHNLIGLNGIVYHPDGYLLVVHTSSGCLFKITVAEEENEVSVVRVGDGCSLAMGDGLELVSPTELVVAGAVPSARLVESKDGWKTGRVKGRFYGPMHRIATAATAAEGKVYVSHLVGGTTHVITEAVFSRVQEGS